MANDATIKVYENYEIYIDCNRDHEAREFLKIYVNPKTGVKTNQYRSIGHYSNIPSALQSIAKDMTIQKASKKEIVTIKEFIDMDKESHKTMMEVINNSFKDLL